MQVTLDISCQSRAISRSLCVPVNVIKTTKRMP